MAEINPNDPTNPPSQPPQETTPPRKRRKWPYVVIGIFVLILILILLIPTIASTAPVRSLVVSTINDNLNGKIAINDWSIGWTSGVTINGVKIDDEKGSRVLEVSQIRVPVKLLDAARGNLDLGEIVIDKPNLVNVVLQPDGSTNLEKLAKPAKKQPEPAEETTLPDIKGKITINELRGTISGQGLPSPVTIEPSTIKVEIPSINDPIVTDGTLTYRVGNTGSPSSIAFAGKVDAIDNNKVAIDKLAADQTVTLKDVDLSAIAPFVGPDTTLTGITNGNLQVKAQGLQSLGATGNIAVANFSYGGAALSGDVYKSSKIDIPIEVTSADGVMKITKLSVNTDHVALNVTGQVPQSALENVAAQKAPGANGAIAIAFTTKDLKGLSNQLRNTLALQKEVEINSGTLAANVDIAFTPANVGVKQKLDVQVEGTNAGKPIKLDPVHLETALTSLPGDKPLQQLRDITLNLTSAFASATGGGKSIDDLNITANFDLAKAHAQLAQFVDFAGQTFAGTGTLKLTSKGNLAEPGGKGDVAANLALDNIKLTNPQGGTLNQPHIELATNAAVALGAKEGDATTINISTLNAGSSDNLFSVKLAKAPLVVTLVNEKTTATGEINLAADLKRLLDTLNTYNNTPAPAPNQPGQLQSGNFSSDIALASSDAGTNVKLRGAIENLTVTTAQQPLTNEKVTIDLTAVADPKFQKITVEPSLIQSSFANTKINAAILDLEGKALAMLQKANIEITVPDINKAMAVSDAFSPPATQPTTQPLNIAGSAVVNLDVTRDTATQTTNVTIPTLTASKLTLTRANKSYAFPKDINLKLTAALASAGAAGDQIDKLDIKQLQGDLGGLATLIMPTPITITNLTAATPNANGKIALSGALEPLTQLLSVIQGADPMLYRGDYAVEQNITTAGNSIQLTGNAIINNLIVLDAQNQPTFPKDQVALRNDIKADTSTKTAVIQALNLDMPLSKAIGLNVTGTLANWDTSRQLTGFVIEIPHDMEKLWPIIKPMLAPETQQQLADLKIAHKGTWTFNVAGSYPVMPVGKESEAIKSLTATGAITLDQLNTGGLDLTQFELPVSLANGLITTTYADRPKEQRTAKPAAFNGGTLDLNSVAIDMTQTPMRLAIGKNQPLIRGAATNELLMQNLGKYANSLFAKASKADGKLDVTVEYCDNLPLDATATSDSKARAKILFSLSDMHIVNPIGEQFIKSFVGELQSVQKFSAAIPGLAQATQTDMADAKTFTGRIDQSSITLENGKITEDITLQIIDTQQVAGKTKTGKPIERTEQVLMPLTVKGDLTVLTLLQNLNVLMPARFIVRSIGNDDWEKFVVENFPNGIPFRMGGTVDAPKILPPANLPKIAADWAVKKYVGDKVPGVGNITDILTGKKPPAPQPAPPPPAPSAQQQSQPPQSQPQATTQPAKQPDPVGTLIDIFGKPKKDDKKKK